VSGSPPAESPLDLLPLVLSAVIGGQVARGWLARVGYPFDLEWMEGGMLAHAWRLQHGLPLYPEAGPDWIPYVYPPGYPALIAALSSVTGLDYPLGRWISIAGTVLAAVVLAAMVARRGSWLVGVSCGAIFLGCWRASGAFYDLVRPDGLAIGLLAVVFALARLGAEGRARAQVAAGLVLALAFTVKHHAAALGLPLAFGLWVAAGRVAALRFAVAAAVPAGLFTLAMEVGTGGRFTAYLLGVPATHPWDRGRLFPGTFGELAAWLLPSVLAGGGWLLARSPALRSGVPPALLFGLPAVCALALGGAAWWVPPARGVELAPLPVLVLTSALIGACFGAVLANGMSAVISRAAPDRDAVRWWTGAAVFGTVLTVGLAMRAHNGGFLNVLMPIHFACALGLGLVIADVRRAAGRTWVIGATSALLAVQLGWIAWKLEIDEVIPTEADRGAGAQVVARLKECAPGPIFSPYAAWLPVQAGREPSVPLIALWDIQHPGNPFRDGVDRVKQAAREGYWTCVVNGGRQRLGYGVEESYRVDTTFSFQAGQFMVKTGWRVRPYQVLVPKAGAREP
jgi:hypothetical protein